MIPGAGKYTFAPDPIRHFRNKKESVHTRENPDTNGYPMKNIRVRHYA